jgi:hypothetical protein
MAPSPHEQQRTHNTLLFQKLLNGGGASPFTLILDTLDQRSGSIVKEFARRAKVSFLISLMFVLDILSLVSAFTKNFTFAKLYSCILRPRRGPQLGS